MSIRADGFSGERANNDDADALLDRLFAAARSHPPRPEQLRRMLRAVPRPLSVRRWLGRLLGAAAVSAAGVAFAMMALTPTAAPAFAAQRMVTAMRAAPIVYTVDSTGYERWIMRDAYLAARSPTGDYVRFWDFAAETDATYRSESGAVLLSTVELWPKEPLFVFETLEQVLKSAESGRRSVDEIWRVTREVQDGRAVFVVTALDPTDDYNYVVDVETDRILRTSSLYTPTVTYEYPDSGPSGLADVGVPNDAPVIDGRAPPELHALRERVEAERNAGFGDYVAVKLASGGTGFTRVTNVGAHLTIEDFDGAGEPLDDPNLLFQRAEALLTTDPDGLCLTQRMTFDGEVETSRSFDADGSVTYEFTRRAPADNGWFQSLEGESWMGRVFFHPWPERQDVSLGEDEDGRVGYRSLGQANQISRPWLQEWWFDPQHGYRLARMRSWDGAEADWQLSARWRDRYSQRRTSVVIPPADSQAHGSEARVLEWAELRPGQWYPALKARYEGVAGPNGEWTADSDRSPEYSVIVATPLD